jgi:small basic protein
LKTRLLFIVTAVLEVGIGLALLVSPALAVSILIGAPFGTSADSVVGRVGGAALLALGAASWLARNDEHSRAAKGLIVSMFLYNVAAVVVLVYAGVGLRLFGIGLWPAVVLHSGMSVWCLANVAPGLETRRPRGREVT